MIVFAASVNLGTCWLAFVPVATTLSRRRGGGVEAILAATVIRLLLVMGTALGAGLAGVWPTKVLAVWLAVFYLLLLSVETGWAIRLANRWPEGAEGPAAV